jgi:hypothetical protein
MFYGSETAKACVAVNGAWSMRLLNVLPALLFSTAALLRADVTINSGTITSTGGYPPQGSINIQGPNLTLQGNTRDGSIGLLNVIPDLNGKSVTILPQATATSGGPLSLVYNGNSYGSILVALNFAGAPVTVANPFPAAAFGNYQGDISAVPFTMSGSITVFSGPLNGPVLFTVPISGSGLYSAHVQGNFLAGGPGRIPGGLVTYTFYPSPSTLFSTDTSTQGAWTGNYGGEGFFLANGPSSPPSYATLGFSQASTYTWANQTTDPRALQNGLGAASNIASAYDGNSFNININFSDGFAHRVALYLLDFDTTSRSETITITNTFTQAVLDTETFSNFNNGIYAIWNLQGNVTINVSRSGGSAAVVSGIFFGSPGSISGPGPGSSSSASYIGVDTATKGSWTGGYGANGYLIANNTGVAPAYATASVTGDFTYTWAAQTSDPRALQSFPYATTGIASSYTQYGGQSFTISININDGGTHRIALYLLDWEAAGRVETITITDPSTGALLDSETFSGFQNGEYPSWLIKGNVLVKVTPVGTFSPVVSGVFFN